MNSLSSSASNKFEVIKVNLEIKQFINSFNVSDLLLLKVISKSNYEIIEKYFKSHPTLGLFYKGASYLDENIKKSYLALEEPIFNDNGLKFELSENTVYFGDGFCFDCAHMNKIINSSNKEQIGFFYDEINEQKHIKPTFSFFITVFLMIQLHEDDLDITKFVNDLIFDRPFELYLYEGLGGEFSILNGYYKNSSKDQNHRLAAVLMYNNIIAKKGLPFKKIEQLAGNRLKIYKKIYGTKQKSTPNLQAISQKSQISAGTNTVIKAQKGIKGRIKKLFGGN